jgi:outer membrane protein assembly factor BamB
MAPPSGITIDLGELPPHDEVRLEPDPWWPGVRRRWRHRRTWQLAGAAVVTALTAVTVTAAATPASPAALSHQFTVAGLSPVYDEHALYILDGPDQAANGQTTITAYRLADGTVRWQASLPARGSGFLAVQHGTLLATSARDTETGNADPRTTRLDPDTGERLWTNAGWPGQLAGGWLVLERELAAPTPEERDGEVVPWVELTVVDLATGAAAWRTDVLGWAYDLDADGTMLVTIDEHRDLRSYDLATGEPMAARSLPTPDELGPESYYGGFQVIGPVVVLQDPAAIISAFDVATLAPRWRSTEPIDESGQSSWPIPCAGLVCLTGSQPPRALDSATGELRWSADWLPPEDGRAIWYDITDIGAVHPDHLADHLVVTQIRESWDDQTSWLVEAGAGAPVLDLGGWRFLTPAWEQPATTTAPLLAWQDDHTIWIGRLRPDLSGVVAIGAIDVSPSLPDDRPAALPYCDAQGDHLVCIYDGEGPAGAKVWRLQA